MDKDIIKKFYEKVGNGEGPYDKKTNRFAPTGPTDKIIEIAMKKDAKNILDIGCGMGISIIELSKKLPPDVCFVGIDINESMIKKAKENVKKIEGLSERTRFIIADAEELPCRSDYFDMVFSECVFNLISNRKNMLDEINRVLKKNGLLAYSDFVSFKEVPESVRMNNELGCGCQSGSYTLSDNIKSLEKCYFSNIECTNYEDSQKERKNMLEESSEQIKKENEKLRKEFYEEIKFLDEEVIYYLITAEKKQNIPDEEIGSCCCKC